MRRHLPNSVVCGQISRRDKEKRQHLRRVSVRSKVRSVRHALNDWEHGHDANTYSLVLMHKQTDSPVSIPAEGKATGGLATDKQADKTHRVGFHTWCSFSRILKFKEYSSNWSYFINWWHQNWKQTFQQNTLEFIALEQQPNYKLMSEKDGIDYPRMCRAGLKYLMDFFCQNKLTCCFRLITVYPFFPISWVSQMLSNAYWMGA